MAIKEAVNTTEALNTASNARIILDLDPPAAKQIDQMAQGLGLKRRTEVVRYALGLLNLYVEHIDKGYDLLLQKDEDVKRIVVPRLTTAASR